MGTDPVVEDGVFLRIVDTLRKSAKEAQNGNDDIRWFVPRLSGECIKQICKSLGRREKILGERFVQIKRRLSAHARVEMVPNFWLPDNVVAENNRDFVTLSHAFDTLLYQPGRHLTMKDKDLRSDFLRNQRLAKNNKKVQRHNMLNYHFIQRELIKKNAPHLYELASVDFFFPLPRTVKVLGRLVEMYNVLAEYCNFPPSMLTEKFQMKCLEVEPPWTLESWAERYPRIYCDPNLLNGNVM